MALSLNDVNRKYTFTWIKCNDDAKSPYFRKLFIQKFGGEFVKIGRYWEWMPSKEQIIFLESSIIEPPTSQIQEPTKTWIFKNINGEEVKTKNIQEFCKTNKLTRSSLYEVISGKRKHHKGFSFIESVME
jgi:hypothetical protein